MTAPLPNELKPEVREALARAKESEGWHDYYRNQPDAKAMIALAAEVSRLHAERAGVVEGLPEGCPSVAYWSPAWGLRNALPLGPHLGCVEVEIHPKGTRSRLQASPREPWLPMEAAPRDGTRILLADASGVSVCAYRKFDNGFMGRDCWYSGSLFWTETGDAWMPLPLPPPPSREDRG